MTAIEESQPEGGAMWFAGLIIGGLIEGLAWRLMRQLSAGDTGKQ